MGVESHSMFDPFEILGLEKSFLLDLRVLDQKYFEMLKKTHPDKFINDESAKSEVLKKAGEINKAYGMLKDPLGRASVLLKEAGVKPLDHDPLFLGEIMTFNERMDEGEDIREELVELGEELMLELTEAFQEEDYKKAKVALYRLTYVRTLLVSMGDLR